MQIDLKYKKDEFYKKAEKIVQTLQQKGYKAFFVGGCVRDAIMGTHPHEFDIATSAKPEEIKNFFPKTIPVGESFGVILVLMNGQKYEVATFRKEKDYKDGRRPSEVLYTNDEKEDVERRDFTINGLLYDPVKKELLDYVNGLRDIKKKIIRTIGDPFKRFEEDKLRMIRAVRFSARFDFPIEEKTFDAISTLAHKITEVSMERIRDELIKIITQKNPGKGLKLLKKTGLLKYILPEVAQMEGVAQPPEFHPEGDVFEHTCLVLDKLYEITNGNYSSELAIGALLHDVGKPPTYEEKDRIRFNGHDRIGAKMARDICKRLKFSKKQTERITQLVREHLKFKDVFHMRESTLRKFISIPYFEEHLTMHLADCLASHGMTDAYDFIKRKIKEYEEQDKEIKPKPLINGYDLIALGYKPGPLFSKILKSVEEQQLEGTIKTKEEALKYVLDNFKDSRSYQLNISE